MARDTRHDEETHALDRLTADRSPGREAMVPASYAEKAMSSLMRLHEDLVEEKERRIDLYRRLMDREQNLAELKAYVRLLESELVRKGFDPNLLVLGNGPTAASVIAGVAPPQAAPAQAATAPEAQQPAPAATQPAPAPAQQAAPEPRPEPAPAPQARPAPAAPASPPVLQPVQQPAPARQHPWAAPVVAWSPAHRREGER